MPYDQRWPVVFAAERTRLRGLLSPWLAGDVEHIGSTAVPGLAAKPILDVLAGVARLASARQAVPLLEADGWVSGTLRPHEALWFSRAAGAAPAFHLHLTEVGSDLWRERLTFRDALRADPHRAEEYGRLKLRLAGEVADLRAYTDRKRAFVIAVLAEHGVVLAP